MIKKIIERLKDYAFYIIGIICCILFGIYALGFAITFLLAPIAFVYDFFKALAELF